MYRTVVRGARPGARVFRRGFSATPENLKAKLLNMPAMSPTMTEGGIVEWKFKEGDSFQAGDVLLEVETDKAQIDVEADDEGILVKIYKENGSKNVQVGAGIAVLAEPGDDINSIEIPKPEDNKPAEAPKQEPEPAKEAPKKEPEPAKEQKATPAKAGSSTKANPNQTLLPSVQNLLHANNISSEDALAKIAATGPNGRLLKGDVLSYLGKVSQEYVDKVLSTIASNQHLDLSNIKIKQPQEETAKAEDKGSKDQKAADKKAAAPEPVVIKQTIALTEINLLRTTVSSTLSSDLSVSTLVNKASKLAERDVPKLAQARKSVLNDPLFEDLITPRVRQRAFDATVTIEKAKQSSAAASKDIFDLLTSNKRALSRPSTKTSAEPQTVSVSVKVNSKVPNAETKARLYVDRLQYYLTKGTGELIL
uniref:Dihydrolipoamide dehydrogenase-binding protein of pyruvate dehydrogenase complex n=1 Tax=Blastobotrys adeninivorans TaxID=409370 RepID=A0A060T5B7_BLAAD